MQDKIYKIVFELRNKVMTDLKNSQDFNDKMLNGDADISVAAISGHTFGLKKDYLIDELTYYLLLRIFILKYIIQKGKDIPGFISVKDLHADINTIKNIFENLSEHISLFSNEYFAYVLPKAETFELIENKLDLLVQEASEDDFAGNFYEAYNYYRTQSKEESLKQNNDNTAITDQIYTPLWLCRLLVRNALSDIPNSAMPEDIKIFDPSCGCGNFLIAAFDELIPVYISKGYKPADIPVLIIENNIHGFDIEDKALQIAEVILLIKSWSNSGNSEPTHFNLFSSAFKTDSNAAEKHLLSVKTENTQHLVSKFKEFSDVSILGSLISINNNEHKILDELSCFTSDTRYGIETGRSLNFSGMVKLLTNKYDIVLSNPPFAMPYLYEERLKEFIRNNFTEGVDFSNNLYSCFIKRAVELTKDRGQIVMLHPANLFFDKKFSEVRSFLKKGLMFRYLISFNSRAVFGSYVKLFDIIIYSLKKDKPLKKVVFRRYADSDTLLLKDRITEIMNNEKGLLKSDNRSSISLRKALFFLSHPNLYDMFLNRFF